MNRTSGTFGEKAPRYEELAVPKNRIDRTSHHEPFKVKRRALSYQITDSLNKLAQPKRSPEPEQRDQCEHNPKLRSKNLNPESENDQKMTYSKRAAAVLKRRSTKMSSNVSEGC